MLKGFGERVRKRRRELDLTQEQIAKAIPMNQSNYSKIEREHQEPSLTQLVQMCDALKTNADYLLGLEEDFADIEGFEDAVEKISTGMEH